MKVTILQQAYRELEDAVDYYEGEQDGLGLRMMEEVDNHVRWITKNPTLPRLREGGYRRVNLKTFPYYIAYMIHEEILWILAISHSHRKPDYWIIRKNELS
ncbi:type II toxin-antitoxin system RelE/ParE family toxin [Thiococcus pfennigii]|uniref:type II toxin-antitoxin system RelE/ParE family toxin n=1 Tax=Thiococcus pfennigii TaxID=1057 RepID=UPI001906A9A7|nr:hypothetical protein [Thiococcus pfennigii]